MPLCDDAAGVKITAWYQLPGSQLFHIHVTHVGQIDQIDHPQIDHLDHPDPNLPSRGTAAQNLDV